MDGKQAAERELDDTIRRLGPTMDLLDADDMIGSWVLVGYAVSPTEDGESRYFHAFSGGSMPTHAAVGLLRVAQVALERSAPEED